MKLAWERAAGFSSVLLRLALGLSFLSAVADRFGWCQLNVVWGNCARFASCGGESCHDKESKAVA